MPPSAGEDAAEAKGTIDRFLAEHDQRRFFFLSRGCEEQAVVLVGDSSGRLAAWPWQRLQPLRGDGSYGGGQSCYGSREIPCARPRREALRRWLPCEDWPAPAMT